MIDQIEERPTRHVDCDCKLMGPPVNRKQHHMTDDNNRTCWACYRPVALVSLHFWYTDEDRHVCLCEDHKDYEGRHGGLADPKYSPKGNALAVARGLRTSTSPNRPGRRASAPPPPPKPLVVKGVDEEIHEGEVIDEVAEFLRKMGKIK